MDLGALLVPAGRLGQVAAEHGGGELGLAAAHQLGADVAEHPRVARLLFQPAAEDLQVAVRDPAGGLGMVHPFAQLAGLEGGGPVDQLRLVDPALPVAGGLTADDPLAFEAADAVAVGVGPVPVVEHVGRHLGGHPGGQGAEVGGAGERVVAVGPGEERAVLPVHEQAVGAPAGGGEVVCPRLGGPDAPEVGVAFLLGAAPGVEDVDRLVLRAGVDERDVVEAALDRAQQVRQPCLLVAGDQRQAELLAHRGAIQFVSARAHRPTSSRTISRIRASVIGGGGEAS